MINNQELRKDAKRFREKFIESTYNKKPEEIEDLELYLINFWINHYQEDLI